jgi:hypothetical protein
MPRLATSALFYASLAAVFAFCPMQRASADTPLALNTGNDLDQVCAATSVANRVICQEFILGVLRGIDAEAVWASTKPPSCVPEGVTIGQSVDVVLQYLSRNPEIRHLSGPYLILSAMHKAFPCSK